ncbi:MAG: penicillin-binding transpeptidase domain-containing protein [Prosthecobacter sp.]
MNAGLDLLSHTALKGSAVLTVALLVGVTLHRLAAARRYAIWISAVAALAVLPFAMALLPAWHVLPKSTTQFEWPVVEPELPVEAPPMPSKVVQEATPQAVDASQRAPVVPPKSRSFDFSWQWLLEWLPAFWLGIAAVMLLRLAWSTWCLRRLERVLKSGSCDVLEKIAQEMSLARAPSLLVGTTNAVPMVWGVWRSCLLLPAGFEQWSAAKLRGVLLHELAHLKRRDPLALWTAQWVKALHWFNPLVWLTIRQLRADQERACDDAVLRQGVRPSDYAQSLLDLSRHRRVAPGLALCALSITRCAPVEARVKAILDPNRRREPITRRWLACLAGFALLITLPVAMLHAIEGPKLRGRILDRHGVVLAESTPEKVRHYPLKALAAHTLGYTGKTSADNPTLQGHAGVEKQHDAVLKSGTDVALSFDIRIQALAHRAMTEAGVTRGAAVVLDPRTGEILASVSLPSYDLNTFIPAITLTNWESYSANRDLPLFDRCLSGQYSPGSAFMPLTALAGISTGVGDKTFDCQSATTSYSARYECLQIRQGGAGHGTVGLKSALQNSCRHFWCRLGMLAGFDAFGRMGKDIGFGQTFGMLEHESAGVLPTQEWWEKRRRNNAAWREDDTASLAEGYGYLLVTPLQMTVLAATVGNSGRVPIPHLTLEEKPLWRTNLTEEGLPEAQIETLREGLRLVVNGDSGTGKAAKSDKVVIAGKTGTAQNWRRIDDKKIEDNHAWFIGFAPFDQPTLAFAILKQGGKNGGGDCGPIAKRIVEEALALPADGSGEVKPVGDAAGDALEKAEVPDNPRDRHVKLGELTVKLKALKGEKPFNQTAYDELVKEIFRLSFREQAGPAEYVRDIETRPIERDRWQEVQRSGGLAGLPSEALVQVLKDRDTVRVGSTSVDYFRFTAPREAVRAWLLASLSEKRQKSQAWGLEWPDAPESFERTYFATDECLITIHSPDGKLVQVTVQKRKRPILIAPDEATPPKPKTAAPKELEGVVSGQLVPEAYEVSIAESAPAAPGMFTALSTAAATSPGVTFVMQS